MDNVNIQTQQMLAKGGFAAGGMNKDPVSGNEVPVGSLPHEVRDDVPAQLSEGEFVLPADVVRFIGLQKLMQLRDKAKEGLKRMNDMGQMGNSEEAKASGENPLGEFDQEEEEGDEGFDEEIDDIMMATGGSVPGKSATGQDMNNWLWDKTIPNSVFYNPLDNSQADKQTAVSNFLTAQKYSGGNAMTGGVGNELWKYLQSLGYKGRGVGDDGLSDEERAAVPAYNMFGPEGFKLDENFNPVTTNRSPEEQAAFDAKQQSDQQAQLNYFQQLWDKDPTRSADPFGDFLKANDLRIERGVHQAPGASGYTTIDRLVKGDGTVVAVDANQARRTAGDNIGDAIQLASTIGPAMMMPGALGVTSQIGAGAVTGAAAGGLGAMSQGASLSDAGKAALKGGITGAAGAGLGQLAGEGWNAFMQSDVLPESWMQGLSNAEQGASRLAGQIKEGLGLAKDVASSAPATVANPGTFDPVVVSGSAGAAAGAGSALGALGGTAAGITGGLANAVKPDVVLDKTEITGQRPVPDNSNVGGVAGGIVGGNVSPVTPDVKLDKVEVVGERKEPDTTAGTIGGITAPITVADPGKFDKVEVVGKKPDKPKDDYLDNLPIIQNPIDPTPVNRVPDKAPDAPAKDSGKTKLPKLPIREALLAAGIGAIAKSGGSSDTGGGATTLSRSNNPVVDYRPVDNQMEQLFINNRPTGRMKKRYAVGGDVNLDAYDFFAQRD